MTVRNKPAWFVAGTDTEVGKSLMSAALLQRLAQHYAKVAGMKPVAAGTEIIDGARQNADVHLLQSASSYKAAQADVCPWLLDQACAPHIAAQQANVSLCEAPVLSAFNRLRAQADALIVEGVGGFQVPLRLPQTLGAEDAGWDTTQLAQALQLPVILVVGLRLGCLNHALLTAQAIHAAGLTLAGWVGNSLSPNMLHRDENIATLKQLLPAPCLGVVPFLDEPNMLQRSIKAAQYLNAFNAKDAKE